MVRLGNDMALSSSDIVIFKKPDLSIYLYGPLSPFLFSEIKDDGGLFPILRSVENGNYTPIPFLIISIVLLAYALKNSAAYFKPGNPE
jgi:hypothetical protein